MSSMEEMEKEKVRNALNGGKGPKGSYELAVEMGMIPAGPSYLKKWGFPPVPYKSART